MRSNGWRIAMHTLYMQRNRTKLTFWGLEWEEHATQDPGIDTLRFARCGTGCFGRHLSG